MKEEGLHSEGIYTYIIDTEATWAGKWNQKGYEKSVSFFYSLVSFCDNRLTCIQPSLHLQVSMALFDIDYQINMTGPIND